MHRIIAVLLSDGYVNPRRYTVSFTENDELVRKLINEFRWIKGIQLEWRVDKHHNSLRARAYSKNLMKELFKICNTFRTRPCRQHPACNDKRTCKICEETNGFPAIKIQTNLLSANANKREFLKYFASCDGGVSLSVSRRKDNNCLQVYTEMKIGSTNHQIKALIKSLLLDLGFRSIIEKKSGLSIKNHKNLIKFQQEIGFLPEARVRRGLFKGLLKNELLDLAIKCKNRSKEGYWINKLGTKKKVINFILSLRE